MTIGAICAACNTLNVALQGDIQLKKIIFLLVFTPLWALGTDPTTIQPNKEYFSKGMINIRDAPPKTMFYILGEKQGLVRESDVVTVTEVKEVNTILDTHYWLKVERLNPQTQKLEKGWIYAGKEGSQSYLEPKK